MLKGNPGAILGLAVASVFLGLGWTGRLAAAWDAMRFGPSKTVGSGSPGLPPGSNGTPGDIEQNNIAYVTVIRTGEPKTIALADLPAASWGETCPPQLERIRVDVIFGPENVVTEGTEQCVDPAKLMPDRDVPISRAGQVVDEHDVGITLLPTGVFARRYQPNVHNW